MGKPSPQAAAASRPIGGQGGATLSSSSKRSSNHCRAISISCSRIRSSFVSQARRIHSRANSAGPFVTDVTTNPIEQGPPFKHLSMAREGDAWANRLNSRNIWSAFRCTRGLSNHRRGGIRDATLIGGRSRKEKPRSGGATSHAGSFRTSRRKPPGWGG